MDKLQVGVIGVGQMGARHAQVLAHMPQVELVALADRRLDRCQAVAKQLGVPTAVSDYRELLDLPEVHAVSICTPDELHRDPVLAACAAGKHILLEKPLATDLAEARELVAAVNRTGVKAMVAHLLRFDPRYAQVKAAADRGDLGDLIYIVSHRNSPHTEGPRLYKPGTSLTMHVAVHDLDLIDWLMPGDPVWVSAQAAEKLLRDRRMHDAVSAVLAFENGAIASVNYSWCLPEQPPTRLDARMEIVGTSGAAYVGSYPGQGVLLATQCSVDTPDLQHGPVVSGSIRGDLREEIFAFVDCVLKDRESPVPVEEALRSVAMGHAILQSLAQRRPVELSMPKPGGDGGNS
ncbi:MAG: Gfo/Idh/MocA family protein [Candidatus Bipolaricaulaceae bacterium]